jgi:D-alanine-D-alanine ligase
MITSVTPLAASNRNRPSARIRVAVIGGGKSSEHEVSLASASAVAAALDPTLFEVVSLTLERDQHWSDGPGRFLTLVEAVQVLAGCDVAFPLLHGQHGEDGTIAALLELANIPYVGSGVGAGALAMDKWVTKLVAEALGIMVAPAVLLTPATAAGYVWDHPVVVKPVNGGSSHGVALARSGPELHRALATAFTLDDRVLVEDLVSGREIDMPVLRTAAGHIRIGPAVEIVTDGLFDTTAKYGGAGDFLIPAPLAAADRDALRLAAERMFAALGCRGVARVDFFLTEAGLVLNEVNTAPGFTTGSQVPLSFAADGLNLAELVEALIHEAVLDDRSQPIALTRSHSPEGTDHV